MPAGDAPADRARPLWPLVAAMLLSSAAGLVLEIAAGRLIAPYVGMSLYTWTAVIAVILAGLSIGHWIGGYLAEAGRTACLARLAGLLVAAGLAALGVLPLARLTASTLLAAPLDPILGIVVLTAFLFLLPSLLIGTVSPILTKLALDARRARPAPALGTMFAAGAAGAIAGTLLAGYLFIAWLGVAGTLLTVAAVLGGLGAIAALAAGRSRLVLAPAAVAAAAIGLGGAWLDAFASPCTVESDYYCIRVVAEQSEGGRPLSVMVLDHLVHSVNDEQDPTRLHSPYLQLVDHLLDEMLGQQSAPAMFFVGGGANTAPRAWQARYPRGSFLVAEIDPAVTEAAIGRMDFTPGPNTRIRHRDARQVLAALPEGERFDLVLGDAFQDLAVPFHLTTREFAELVARRLTPSGFFATNLVDSGTRPEFLFAYARTLAEAFRFVEVFVPVAQAASGARAAYVVVALHDRETRDQLVEGALPEGWAHWPRHDLARRIARSGAPLLTDDHAPIDRLLRAVLRADLDQSQGGMLP